MTELSAAKLADLRGIAGKATPGPWFANSPEGNNGFAYVDPMQEGGQGSITTYTSEQAMPDAEHIAAFDPPTVLALLDLIAEQRAERDKLLAKLDRVRELHKGQVDDFGDRFCVTCWSSDWPCLTLQAIGESDD